jgi:predicted nucleic acid-binding Zn finger protein
VLERYGEQGRRALAAAEAGSVKRYLDFVVVAGCCDGYIVEDGLCTCDRSLIRNGFCWHQLAARIAVLSILCEEYDLWYHAALECLPDEIPMTGAASERRLPSIPATAWTSPPAAASPGPYR